MGVARCNGKQTMTASNCGGGGTERPGGGEGVSPTAMKIQNLDDAGDTHLLISNRVCSADLKINFIDLYE